MFPVCAISHGTYFTPSDKEDEEILLELSVKKLGVELWLKTCSSEELKGEALGSCFVFCSSEEEGAANSVRYVQYAEPAPHYAILQPLRYHCLISRWSKRGKTKLKERSMMLR